MLLFQDKVKVNQSAFIAKVMAVADRLGIPADWLMAVINSETAGTFRPDIQNKKTQATGLIQFMPDTAIGLGTTIDALKKLSNVDQMEYVEKYFKPYKDLIDSFEDLYLITFYPNADGVFGSTLKKPDNWKFPKTVFWYNPGLDKDGDGFITIKEFRAFAFSKVPSQFHNLLYKAKRKVKQHKGLIAILALALIIFLIWYAQKKGWLSLSGSLPSTLPSPGFNAGAPAGIAT